MKKYILACLLIALTTGAAQAKEKKDKKKPAGPWFEAEQPTFAKSDLGRVYSNTLDLRGSDLGTIKKPQVIRIGDNKEATVVFDTEKLLCATAIPERFMMFNTYRNGLGGSGNWMGPPYIFSNNHNGLKGRYNGLYRHGEKVILSYTIGGVDILEFPWAQEIGGQSVVTRSLHFSSDAKDLTIPICTVKDAEKVEIMSYNPGFKAGVITHGDQVTVISVAPDGSILRASGNNGLELHNISKGFTKLRIWTGNADEWTDVLKIDEDQAEPLTDWTRGGPALWTADIVTQGEVGKAKEGFAVDTLTPPFANPYKALLFFGGHDFFSNGDAAICTMHGDVWRVSGIDAELKKLTWKRYATGMFHPLGLKVVDDQVYITCRDQLTRLHDFNGDNEADFYEAFNHEIEIGKHVHEFATGLDTDPEGNFYFVKGNNGGQSKHDGSVIRISKDGKTFEQFATGFRWPNGSGMSPDGVLTVADQQGTWVPSSKIDIVRQGGFYGYVPAHHREVEPTKADPPLCWIPHPIDNSCGGQTWIPKGQWGALSGKMVHLSYGRCEAFLVLQENTNGMNQGGVVKLPVHFSSGAMRTRFNPSDNHLYVSGLKGWQTSGAKDGCFQRVRMVKKETSLPIELNVLKNGIRIRFAQDLDDELAEDLSSWSLERWNYRWTKAYGSKDYKVSNPEEIGRDALPIKSAKLAADKRTVFLEIDDLKPVMQMGIKYDLETTDGDILVNAIYHTIHTLGTDK